jgi:hypothetical protein
MSSQPATAVSPDGRYQLEVLDDPYMESRLAPELRLLDTTTGDELLRLNGTRLTRPAQFSADGVVLRLEHHGQPATVQISFTERTYQCDRHHIGRPLPELPAYLAYLRERPSFAVSWAEILKEMFWLLIAATFCAGFLWAGFSGHTNPQDGWWLLLGIGIAGISISGATLQLKELLRRPRR